MMKQSQLQFTHGALHCASSPVPPQQMLEGMKCDFFIVLWASVVPAALKGVQQVSGWSSKCCDFPPPPPPFQVRSVAGENNTSFVFFSLHYCWVLGWLGFSTGLMPVWGAWHIPSHANTRWLLAEATKNTRIRQKAVNFHSEQHLLSSVAPQRTRLIFGDLLTSRNSQLLPHKHQPGIPNILPVLTENQKLGKIPTGLTFTENICLIRVFHVFGDLFNDIESSIFNTLFQRDLISIQNHILVIVGT